MVKIKINGIPIDMPHPPYPSQIVTMSKLLACFQNDSSALIESPTGTGKSLAIICSVLGFNTFMQRNIATDDKDRKPFKVFICSRTHKQLDQLVEQLKKTIYRPRIAILGSRAQYCINPRLKNTQDKNTACSDLVKTGGCVYFNGKDRLIKKVADMMLDIEELRSEGKRCAGCPYYAARMLVEDADIVFAPYNYLIDSGIRLYTDISLANAIVIIDEAHNIEDVCRAAGSVELSSQTIDIVANEMLGAIKKSAMLGEIKADFINIFELFRKLRLHSDPEEFDTKGRDCSMRIRKGKGIIEELESMEIKREFFAVFKASLKAIRGSDDAKELVGMTTTHLLGEIERVFSLIDAGCESYAFCFQKFHGEPARYAYNFWLLDPGAIFEPFVHSVKSVTLLSGTLSPFSSFHSELRFPFKHQVTAPHILRDEQVFIASIQKGHLGRDLCGVYAVAETPEYLDQVSSIIASVAKAVCTAGGTLVFVPSYAALGKLAARIKDAIVEPKVGGTAEFEKCLKRYQARIAQRVPAIMLCVYRGKAAEGINFEDQYARAVVAVGIPYPSIADPQISLKKEYNDANSRFTGRMWYEAQAYRAMNQALGRIVRHASDWGAIFLLDSRMCERKNQGSLSSWIAKGVRKYERYADCTASLKEFVRMNSEKEN